MKRSWPALPNACNNQRLPKFPVDALVASTLRPSVPIEVGLTNFAVGIEPEMYRLTREKRR
jgi:hypothetical protein